MNNLYKYFYLLFIILKSMDTGFYQNLLNEAHP